MSDDEDSKNVKLVSIKTPVFSETAIRGWFPIMEAQFTLKGITATQTKFYSVCRSSGRSHSKASSFNY